MKILYKAKAIQMRIIVQMFFQYDNEELSIETHSLVKLVGPPRAALCRPGPHFPHSLDRGLPRKDK